MKTFLKNYISLFLFTVLLLNVFPSTVFAKDLNEKEEPISPSIAREAAKNFAENLEIEYSETDMSYPMNTHNSEETNATIELYDANDDIVGYLVCIKNGYIVVSNSMENPKVLYSQEGYDTLEILHKKISNSSKLYYFFPSSVLTEAEKDEYIKQCKAKNRELISNPYSSEDSSSNLSVVSSTPNVDIRLSREANFVSLTHNKQTYYGGNQDWFKSENFKRTGCGVIALTNTVSYLAQNGYVGLYDGLPVNYNNYFHKMTGLANNYLTPNQYVGIATPGIFCKGANKFFNAKGANLKATPFVNNYSYNVKKSLKKDIPVPFLVYFDGSKWTDSSNNTLDFHWITITKYFQQGTTKQEFIAFSTWGRREHTDFGAMTKSWNTWIRGGITVE